MALLFADNLHDGRMMVNENRAGHPPKNERYNTCPE
jgi:hypothetical protein